MRAGAVVVHPNLVQLAWIELWEVNFSKRPQYMLNVYTLVHFGAFGDEKEWNRSVASQIYDCHNFRPESFVAL